MAIIKRDENELVAWDYPYKGCLFDKTRQVYAECNRKEVETYLMITGNLGKLNWKPIEHIHDQDLIELDYLKDIIGEQ